MRKSICIEKIFLELDFYDRFQAVAEAGFHYVEFWSWENKDLNRVKELCAKYCLKVASMSGDKDYSLIIAAEREQYLKYLERSMQAAKQVECNTLVLHSNAINEKGRISNPANDVADDEKQKSAVETLCAAAELAEKYDILLVLEALNTNTQPGCYLVNTSDSVRIVRQVKSAKVKILYDVWHMVQMEDQITENLRLAKEVLGYLHIADSNGRHEPGTGDIDFKQMLSVLKELDYNGVYGFELVPLRTSREACQVITEFGMEKGWD